MPAFLKPSGQIASEALDAGVRGFNTTEAMIAERQRRKAIAQEMALRDAQEARTQELHDPAVAFANLRNEGQGTQNAHAAFNLDFDRDARGDRLRSLGSEADAAAAQARIEGTNANVAEGSEADRIARFGIDNAATKSRTTGQHLRNKKRAGVIGGEIASENARNHREANENVRGAERDEFSAFAKDLRSVVDDYNAQGEEIMAAARLTGKQDEANLALNEVRENGLAKVVEIATNESPEQAAQFANELDTVFLDETQLVTFEFEKGDDGETYMYAIDKEGQRMDEDPDGPDGPEKGRLFRRNVTATQQQVREDTRPTDVKDAAAKRQAEARAAGRSTSSTAADSGGDGIKPMTAKQQADVLKSKRESVYKQMNLSDLSTDQDRMLANIVASRVTVASNPAKMVLSVNLGISNDARRMVESKQLFKDGKPVAKGTKGAKPVTPDEARAYVIDAFVRKMNR